MTFHSEIMNVVVLLAELWVCNSNVFGIGGKGPLGSFDAHANSVAVRESATNVEYRVPRFGAKRYLIPVLYYRGAFVGIPGASDEGSYEQTSQEKNKATHGAKYSTAVSPVLNRGPASAAIASHSVKPTDEVAYGPRPVLACYPLREWQFASEER